MVNICRSSFFDKNSIFFLPALRLARKAVSMFETWGLPKEKIERFTRAYLDAVKCVIMRVTPERMVTFDYGKDDMYNNFVKNYL